MVSFFLRALITPFVLLIVLVMVRLLSWQIYPFLPRGLRRVLFTDIHHWKTVLPPPAGRAK